MYVGGATSHTGLSPKPSMFVVRFFSEVEVETFKSERALLDVIPMKGQREKQQE